MKSSIWRVPVISLVAGVLSSPIHTQVVLRYAMTNPEKLFAKVSLLTSAGILLATLFLGGFTLLRNQTKREIAVSAAVVSGYGILLTLIQLLVHGMGGLTGPAVVAFSYLFIPLDWTAFISMGAEVLQNQFQLSMWWIWGIGWLRFLVPFAFVLFGKSQQTKEENLLL